MMTNPVDPSNRNDDRPTTDSADLSELTEEERANLLQANYALSFLDRVRADFSERDQNSTFLGLNNSSKNTEAFVDHPTLAETTSSQTDNQDIPKTFGRFQILETVGQGGFAMVFRAHDPKLSRDVALKIPKAHVLESAEAQIRFQREAQAAAMLSHPAIVAVYEASTVGPVSYIASEFCPGQTLSDLLRSPGSIPNERTAAQIVARLAEAVQHAHQRGVVHRDLKPANILVQNAVENGMANLADRVRVTDFGLARQTTDQNSETLTAEGAIVGTPAYMSPEQARGSKSIGPGTDIYSLSIILYELLTGQVPFLKSNHIETLLAIENETATPPGRINPNVSRDLEAICLQGLNKSPQQRYATSHDLAEDLNAWLDGRNVTARHATSFEKTSRWIRRNPKVAAAVGFAASCLLVGSAVSGWQWYLKQNSLVEVNSQRQRAQRNVARLDSTIKTVIGEFAEDLKSNKNLSDGQKNSLRELLFIQGQMLQDESGNTGGNLQTAQSLFDIADVYHMLGDYREAAETGQSALSLAKAIDKSDPEYDDLQKLQVAMLTKQSAIYYADSQYPESQQAIQQAITVMYAVEDSFPHRRRFETWYDIHQQLADTLDSNNRSKAIDSQRDSIKMADKLLAIDANEFQHQSLKAIGLQKLAWFFWRDRRQERTELFLEAIEYYEQVDTDGIPPAETYHFRHQMANTRSQASRLLLSEKQYDNAIEQLTQAIGVFDQLLVENPHDTAVMNDRVTTLVRLCSYHLESKRTDGILERFPEWIAAAEALPENRLRARWSNWFRLRLGRYQARELEDFTSAHQQLDRIIATGPGYLEIYDNEIVVLRDLTGALTSKAEWYMKSRQLDEAVATATLGEKYNNLLLTNYPNARLVAPNTTNQSRALFLARMRGLKHIAKGDLAAARDLVLEKLQLAPDSPRQNYVCARNLAKCGELSSDAKKESPNERLAKEIAITYELALKQLDAAVELGFRDQQQLDNDDAWNLLRATEQFQEIASRLRID